MMDSIAAEMYAYDIIRTHQGTKRLAKVSDVSFLIKA